MTTQTEPRQRSATALLLVVICLIVVTGILGAMMRHILLANRQAKQLARKAQATWLAESGLERAATALNQNNEFRSDTWELSPADMNGSDGGRVEIEVQPSADDGFVISVVAAYPESGAYRSTIRRQLFVATQPAEQNETFETTNSDEEQE